MDKSIGVVILLFWIIFGFVVSLFNANLDIGYSTLGNTLIISNPNPSPVDYWNLLLAYTGFFLKSMFLTLPNIPLFLRLFVNVMQIFSGIYLIILLLETIPSLLSNFIPK